MMKFKLTQRRIFTVIAVVLFIAALLPAKWAGALASIPHAALQTAIAPPSAVLTAAGSSLRPGAQRKLTDDSFARMQRHLGQALAYNRQLEARNARLRRQVARLTQSSSLIDIGNVRMVDVRITSLSADVGEPVVTINHGASSGIYKGMAVVSGFNLAGKVIHAGPLTAEVKLITATDTGLSVRIVPPSPAAPNKEIVAWIKYSSDESAFVFTPSVHEPVQKGDLVHLADNRWPVQARGFIVGKVVKIEKDLKNPLNLKKVIIQPLAPLKHLHNLTVLVTK